jgi:hypothetical protein
MPCVFGAALVFAAVVILLLAVQFLYDYLEKKRRSGR